MAYAYSQPELIGILLIMSLTPFITGLENPALSVMIKNFRVEKKVALELGSQLMWLISTVILAILMQSVYALAIGVVLSSLYRVMGSFMVIDYFPKPRMNRGYALEIFHFGKFIFLNTLISFTAMNADILLIGKVLHMKNLGIYSIGRGIGTLIWMVCLQTFLQSYMPAVSSVAGDIPRIARMYRRFTALVLAVSTPASIVLALFSGDIIAILYDPRYSDAAISMFWFSISGILLVLNAVNSNTFIATNKLKFETLSMAVSLVLVLVLVPLGAYRFGLTGAAAGMFISITVMVIVQSVFLWKGLGFPFSGTLHPWLQIVVVTGIITLSHEVLRPVLATEVFHNIPFIILMAILSLAVSGLVYYQWNLRFNADEVTSS